MWRGAAKEEKDGNQQSETGTRQVSFDPFPLWFYIFFVFLSYLYVRRWIWSRFFCNFYCLDQHKMDTYDETLNIFFPVSRENINDLPFMFVYFLLILL